MPHQRFVGYCRASSAHQIPALVLQRHTIRRYAELAGGEIVDWFEEIASASPTARGLAKWQPALARAIARCLDLKATLLVARFDRLSRSTALVAMLLENGPPFVAADMPTASRLMVHVYAAIAEEQRQRIGQRVRAGIAAAKAAGRKRNPHARVIAKRMHDAAIMRAKNILPIMEGMRRGRAMSAPQVAVELNRRGVPTTSGVAWGRPTVFRLWHRFHRKWHTRRFPGRPGSTGSTMAEDRAAAHAERLRSTIDGYRRAGTVDVLGIARCLNRDGHRTVRGREWLRSGTYRLLRRLGMPAA